MKLRRQKNAGTGSGQDGFGIGTIAGIAHLALTSSRPGHTRVSSQSPERERQNARRNRPPNAPLSSELRHCTAYPEQSPEATWAQPLGPGRAVLTRGVSRRSGSVACIRADASPTEVLATFHVGTATHRTSNPFTQLLHTLRQRGWSRHRFATRRAYGGYLDSMPNTLQDPRVATELDRMYTESKNQMSQLRDMASDFNRPMTTAERTEAMSEFYIPVTPEAGRLLYSLVRATRPATVVEFGMSFGISAIHLAAAVRDNGSGRVVTTELSDTKIAAAKQTFAEDRLGRRDHHSRRRCAVHAGRAGRPGRFHPARWLERSVSAGDQAARAASVHRCVGRRRQRQCRRT